MERTKQTKKVTAIFCSDFHLREDTPICRTDKYWDAQWIKVDFIAYLQKRYDCPVIHAGDLFDKWKPSPYLLRETILHIPNKFFTVYGQHDLPQHNLDLVHKCGINVLEAANKLIVLDWISPIIEYAVGCHWGRFPHPIDHEFARNINDKKVLIWHKMTYQGKKPWPTCTDPMAASLLRKYKQFDLIVTGDNHKSFSEEYNGRWLVNPGSLMRMEADEINHKPCVFLWYAKDNSIQQVFIPIVPNVITRDHLEQQKQRDLRISAFVSKLDGDWQTSMSFEENLEEFFKVNNTRESIKQIIYINHWNRKI